MIKKINLQKERIIKMSKKIYLSPSNQDGNLYAYGNTNECEQCSRIADAAKDALERCGFSVKKAAKGQDMNVSINESNSWGADLHIPIHTNAGGGSGTMCMVFSKTPENMRFAEPIYEAVQSVTPGKIEYGIREYPQLAEINSTRAVAVYVEADFHDNARIAKWITENTVTIGEAIAKGICNAYGVPYKDSFYRVQIGAYNSRKSAEALLEKVRAAGFENAFIAESCK